MLNVINILTLLLIMDKNNKLFPIAVFGIALTLGFVAYNRFVVDNGDKVDVEIVATTVPTASPTTESGTDTNNDEELEEFTEEELSEYDGTDPDKPIYIAIDGKIYDVSAKPEYYGEGGVYNFLVGKEAAQIFEDEGIGTDIITERYTQIGVVVK